MSNRITDWREAVVTYLAGALTGVDVVSGRRDGVNRNEKDMVAVFWPGWQQVGRDIGLAAPTLIIRYFPKLSKQPTESSPRDPGPLEQAAVDLMVAMSAKRKSGDFVDDLACHVATVTPHDTPDAWHVEAVVEAVTLNLATGSA